MKPLLLIFALALLLPLGQSSFLTKVESLAQLESESTQDWTPIDTNEAQSDTDIKASLDFGVQQLLKTLLSQQRITSTDYQLTKVLDAKKQNAGKTINYQFQVELSNGQGTTIKATYTVNYKATGERTLGAYSWSMQTKVITSKSVEANENAWIEVSLTELQGDANISGALQFAIDNSIKSAVEKGELAGDHFDISSIKKCYKQTVSGYTFYKFDVDLTDNGGTEITLSATVVVNVKTGERVLRAYNYVATTTLYAERVKLVNSIDGYSKVTTTELSSSTVKTAQSYGIQIIISAVLGEGKIKDGSFQVTKVNNCYKRVVNDWTFYKFEVVLTNSQGVVINATFTVRCNNKSGVQEIAGFSYTVSGQTSTDGDDSNAQYIVVELNDAQKDAEVQNALSQCVSQLVSKAGQSTTFKVTKLTSVYKKILSSGTHFKFEAEAQDDEGTTLTFSCTVRYNIKTGKCDLLAYNYKIVQASQEAGQYTTIDVSQAQSNKEVQTVVNFAIGEVVKKVSQKVSNLNFSVSKYISIQRSSNAKYAFYQCSLELSNGAGATVTTTFTVRLTLKTGACELTSFTYNLTNKKTSTTTESDVSDDDEDGGTYTTVSESSLTTDKDVKTCADFGVKEIIKKVLAKKTIENTDFTISKVNSIQKKVSGSFTTCSFNVELSNGEGWTITATFTVRCDTKSGQCTLKSYKYNYNYNSNWTDSISWTDVDVTKISSDSGATSAANFGIKYVIEKFTSKSGLTFDNYSIQQYNSVQKRVTKTYNFYKFDLVLVNNKGITIYCTFSVQVNLKTGQSEVTAYNYRWVTKKVSTATESDVEDADEEAGTYVELTSDKLTTDKDVQLCVNWGTQEIVNKVLKKNTISSTDFQVSKVISIRKKVTASWIYCYFSLELSNGEGGTITTQFTVRCDAKTGKCVLKSYKYKYNYNASWSDNLDYSDLDLDAFLEDEYAETAATYAIEEIIKKFSEKSKLKYDDFQVEEYNSGSRKTTKNYIFYKFDLNIADTTGITIYLTCSVKYNIKTGACELTAWNYRYTYKKVSTATESDVEDADEESGNYVELTSDQLTSDKDVRNCASFGMQEIINKVTSKNTVSNNNFQISQVISVRKKVTTNWIYCYFSLELSNGEGGTITTQFTVRCDAKTGKCVLKSYKYKYNFNANWADTGDFTDLDVTKISSDSGATSAANFGIKYVIEKFTSSSKLTFDNYSIQQYNSVQKRVTTSFTFYKFDLVLTSKGITIYCTFTVKVNNKSNQSEVTAYNYRWVTKKVSTDTESDVEDADEEAGTYVELTSDKLTSDNDVKLCATWGVQEIINKVLKKNTISNTDFQISQVVSIRKKVTANWTYCYFSLVLSNGEGGTITTQFTVRCNTKTGKCVLKSYKYKYNYDANWSDSGEYTDVDTTKVSSDTQAMTAVNFGIKEIVSKFIAKAGVSFSNYYVQNYNSVQKRVTKSYAFYKFDVDISNGGTYTIFATFTVKITLSTGKCELTSYNYRYSTKKVSTEDESDLEDEDEEEGTYTTLDTTSVTTNSETKTAVNYGISQISAKVAKKKNLSSSTFTISKVNSVKRKVTLKWIYYRFDLVLINNEGWTITCTFTIRCNPKTLACTLKAYKYKATYTEPAPQKITSADIDKDADMKAAMEWGVNQVMNNLKSTGVVSSLNFQVTKVEEGGEVKRSKDGNTYTFNLELTGPYNFVVKISITVYHNTKTNTRTLTSWKLRGTSGVVSAAKSAVSAAASTVSKWFGW